MGAWSSGVPITADGCEATDDSIHLGRLVDRTWRIGARQAMLELTERGDCGTDLVRVDDRECIEPRRLVVRHEPPCEFSVDFDALIGPKPSIRTHELNDDLV